jgi:hypothetical protein
VDGFGVQETEVEVLSIAAVPLSGILCVAAEAFRALSVTLSVPVGEPGASGEKSTPTLQNPPGASGEDVEQVVVPESTVKLVLAAKLANVSG